MYEPNVSEEFIFVFIISLVELHEERNSYLLCLKSYQWIKIHKTCQLASWESGVFPLYYWKSWYGTIFINDVSIFVIHIIYYLIVWIILDISL